MKLGRLIIALYLTLSALLMWGPSTGVAAGREAWSPGSLQDALNSTIASDGKKLWLATMGQNRKGKVRTEVMELSGKHWRRLGGKPSSVSGYELFLALLPGKQTVPCLGDHDPRDRSPRIRCFREGSWQTVSYPMRFRKSKLGALVVRHGHLEASFVDRGGRGAHQTFELTQMGLGPRGPRAVAPPVKLTGLWHGQPVVTIGKSTRGPLKLDLWEANSGRRMIMTHTKNGWRRSAVFHGDGIGNTWGSRSIAIGNSIVSSSTDLIDEEFYGGRIESRMRFSPQRLNASGWATIGEGPLDSGIIGYSQGGVFAVGSRVWAVWMEQTYEGIAFGGLLPTKYRAARLNRALTSVDREIELWAGETAFPGPVKAVQYRGKVAFLYPRQGPDGLQATIDLRDTSLANP